MKIHKDFAIMLGLVAVTALVVITAQAYFWEDFGQPRTQEQLEKRQLDLKYQEKQSKLQQRQAEVAAQARKKQEEIGYKKSQAELERKRKRLELER